MIGVKPDQAEVGVLEIRGIQSGKKRIALSTCDGGTRVVASQRDPWRFASSPDHELLAEGGSRWR